MNFEVIVTCAVTGAGDTVDKSPHVPVTPKEVADAAIEAADAGAACLRINPGNIGNSSKVAEVVAAAKANNCSIRIGVNAGSLEKKLLEKYKILM